jgi:hypothetical protein
MKVRKILNIIFILKHLPIWLVLLDLNTLSVITYVKA